MVSSSPPGLDAAGIAPVAHAARPTCYACFRPLAHCYCGHITPVANRTEIIILQHPRERFHPIGTARIASLGLQRVRVEVDHDRCYSDGKVELRLPPDTGLLYPQAPSRDLATLAPDERPKHLLVIDGTWHHAKTLFRDVPGLDELPRFHLQPPKPSQYRLRREPQQDFVSTVEAITYCLHALEPDTPGIDSLLQVFDKMIDRQIDARRMAIASPRALERARPKNVRRLPRALAERFGDLVVTYGEAASMAPGSPKELLHWTARRLATGELFEQFIRPSGSTPGYLLDHMGVTDAQLASGCELSEFVERWSNFTRSTDILAAWNQATIQVLFDVVGDELPSVYLKSAYHNVGRHSGPLEDIVAAEGLELGPIQCAGRAGIRLANAEQLSRFLHNASKATHTPPPHVSTV